MNAALNFINLPLHNKQASQQALIANADTTASSNLNSLSNIAYKTIATTQSKSQDASSQYINADAMANALNSQANQSTTNNCSTSNKSNTLTNTDNNSINRTGINQSAENHQGNENFI